MELYGIVWIVLISSSTFRHIPSVLCADPRKRYQEEMDMLDSFVGAKTSVPKEQVPHAPSGVD